MSKVPTAGEIAFSLRKDRFYTAKKDPSFIERHAHKLAPALLTAGTAAAAYHIGLQHAHMIHQLTDHIARAFSGQDEMITGQHGHKPGGHAGHGNGC